MPVNTEIPVDRTRGAFAAGAIRFVAFNCLRGG